MMKRILIHAVLLLSACSGGRDDVTAVDAEDVEMNSAMDEARRTLDEFWSEREKSGEAFVGFLKVYFTDEASSRDGEHMWVNVESRNATGIAGELLSSPMWLNSVKQGDRVTFPPERVSDWVYAKEGVAKGAFTVRLLRSRMSDEERSRHDAGYPFRFD